MSQFKFRLATLLRLRESVRDQRRQQLAQAYQAEVVLLEQERRLADESARVQQRVRQAAGPGEVSVDVLLEGQRYEIMLKMQQQQLAQQRQLVQAEIERRRQALVESNREVQVLQRLRERQHERHREEENRRDMHRLDEVAQRRVPIEEVE